MLFDKNIYIVDWQKLTRYLLPVMLRKQKLLLLLDSMINTIDNIYQQFKKYKDNYVSTRLAITPQVCYLEKLLNDRYNPMSDEERKAKKPRIEIINGYAKDPLPLYRKKEVEAEPQRAHFLYLKTSKRGVPLYTKNELGAFASDFIVNIPEHLNYNEKELTTLVNMYKLVSKKFNIIKYNHEDN